MRQSCACSGYSDFQCESDFHTFFPCLKVWLLEIRGRGGGVAVRAMAARWWRLSSFPPGTATAALAE